MLGPVHCLFKANDVLIDVAILVVVRSDPVVETGTQGIVKVIRSKDQSYLERDEPLVQDARGGTINPVKGSTVTFEAAATRELANATLDGRSQIVDGTTCSPKASPSTARSNFA